MNIGRPKSNTTRLVLHCNQRPTSPDKWASHAWHRTAAVECQLLKLALLALAKELREQNKLLRAELVNLKASLAQTRLICC